MIPTLLSRPALARWAPIPLRLIIGYGFFAHGLVKLEKGPDNFVRIVEAIGTPMPHFMAWLTIAVELIGGLAILAGLRRAVQHPDGRGAARRHVFGAHPIWLHVDQADGDHRAGAKV